MRHTDGSTVEILLATFNGEKYIKAQVDSLLSQSYKNIIITARDDGSNDSTVSLLKDYAQKHPNKIFIMEDGEKGRGARGNFAILLQHSRAKYIMCCDQDDVWAEDKVEYFLRQIKFYESVFGDDKPILVHCDLAVADESLKVLAPSLWTYQNIKPAWGKKFNLLLTQNSVTGCSSIMNRSLLSRALPVPDQAVMHDWWLALVACSTGIIVSDANTPTFYRQHGKNTVGAVRYTLPLRWSFLKKVFDRRNMYGSLVLEAAQAGAFSDRFQGTKAALTAKEFSVLPQLSPVGKRLRIIRYGFWKMGFWRNVSWLLRV